MFRKNSVDAKVDENKALAGLSIGYYVARSCPTTLLEPAFLCAVNGVRISHLATKAATAQLPGRVGAHLLHVRLFK